MGAVDRAVDAVPLVIDVRPKRVEESLPFPILRPAVEPVESRLPWTKIGGKISPRHARTTPPKDRFDEVSVIVWWTTGTTFARQKGFDLRPLPFF